MLVLTQVITTLIMVFLSGLLLMWSARIFKLKDKTYMTALKISIIVYAINFVLSLIGTVALSLSVAMTILSLLVLIIGGMYLIKTFYKIDWGKAVLPWLVWFILYVIAGIIVGIIMAAIF